MRDYLARLDERGEVAHIDRKISGKHELAAVTYKVQTQTRQAALFHNVEGTAIPVATNIYGDRSRLCELIGATDGNFCRRWNEILNTPADHTSTVMVEAPESVEELKISDLPHITYCERDAGPYITAGVFMALDPDTRVPNLSFHRTMLVKNDEVRVRLGPPHDLTAYQRVVEERNEPLEVAILIGPPPEVFLGACASIPRDQSEIEIASRIRGAAVPMRRCATIGMDVPADTEIVIEGRILPHLRRPEGPFGEFLWHYTPEGLNHVMEVTRVYRRKGAMFHSLLCGSPEDLMALEVAFASRVYAHLVKDIPGIIDVTCQPTLNTTIVKIRKEYEGHARHVMLKAFASHLQYNKVCIVVDEDIDILNFEQVWWSVMTRTRLDSDIMQLPGMPGFYHDHGLPGLHSGRLGIDATIPEGGKNFDRKVIPGYDTLDLSAYIRP